jgi:dihydrofolate reductase
MPPGVEETSMRKIVAGLFVSLDGVVDMPQDTILPYFDDEVVGIIRADQDEADTILLGRRTYEEFAAYWPEKSAEDDPFADYINRTAKLVASTTLKSVEWENTTLISDRVEDELARRKKLPGQNLSIAGSATLVRSLLSNGLVDELRLLLFPVVVGTGKHLFDGADQMPMRLLQARTLANGVVSLTYEPADRSRRTRDSAAAEVTRSGTRQRS